MKTRLLSFQFSLLALFASASLTFGQGSLTPPAAPAPTMKTLDQIEARTPISSLPFTINASGSYYLTASLIAPPFTTGITINANEVTIDLNGFALIGQGGAQFGNDGIYAPTTVHLRIANGTILGFPGRAISGTIASSDFAKLLASGNGFGGLYTGNDCEFKDCVLTANGDRGIQAGHGCHIIHCISNGNSFTGIQALDQATVESCTVAFNGTKGIQTGLGSTVRNCTVKSNSTDGIYSGGDSQIVGNTCDANIGNGIYASANADRIDSNTLTYNGQWGINLGGAVNLIVRNSFRGNANAPLNLAFPAVYGAFVDMSSTTGPISNTAGPWSNISF
jgi:hypothetical protein